MHAEAGLLLCVDFWLPVEHLMLSVLVVETVFADEGRLTLLKGGIFELAADAGRVVCLDAVRLSLSILMAVDGVAATLEALFGLKDDSLSLW